MHVFLLKPRRAVPNTEFIIGDLLDYRLNNNRSCCRKREKITSK